MAGISAQATTEATRRLAAAGCLAAAEEAAELAGSARGDPEVFASFVERRTGGEPLAWITGRVSFCGCAVRIVPGVYVPRWQSEPLAERAAELLEVGGRAIDLGTGSGAIARVLLERRRGASVLGTELDPVAAACARGNGVRVAQGQLYDGVPISWLGTVDVIVGVLPYVPTGSLVFLPRDVRDFEPADALDGGTDGLDVVRRAVAGARRWLRGSDHLLMEIGGDQLDALAPDLEAGELDLVGALRDDEGDLRGFEAVAGPGRPLGDGPSA